MPGEGDRIDRSGKDAAWRADRRRFLKTAAAISLGLRASLEPAGAAPETSSAAEIPTIELGKHRVSRLIAGGNPVNGGSHLSRFVDHEMREYFTDERILDFLGRLAREGVNTWQSSGDNYEHWLKFRRSGGSMQYISLASAEARHPLTIEEAARMGFLGLAHHGEVTDRLFKSGEIEKAREFLKRVRDSGLAVGLSTHMPAVVEHAEEKGWDLDFYMTCVYERHRSREELKKLLGHVPIPAGEVYLEEDPPRMFKAIRQTRRPCLAFKILAAGRLCNSPKGVADAFEATFKGIKPTDAAIVGIWPKRSDQIAEDAALVRRFGKVGGS